MKLSHTRVIVEMLDIEPHGMSIGERVNLLVEQSTGGCEVTSITIELTEEDKIALRMLEKGTGLSRPKLK